MAWMKMLPLLLLASPTLAATGCASPGEVYHIPSGISNSTSDAEFDSCVTGLDAPKVHPINASAFDWWYFDVVSTTPGSLASIVVVFFTSSASALPNMGPSNTTSFAQVSGSFPNGTVFVQQAYGDGATVAVDGNDSSGNWHGIGFSWNYTPAEGYTILIDAPEIDVKGMISFKSVAPAHYPCGPAIAGQNMEVSPHIGWANAIPDATSTVDLTVRGTKLAFNGAGYHDKNWSNQKFVGNVGSWYWGHGRIGPYSIVWFDVLDPSGTEYVSAYAAKDGSIVVASCGQDSIRVRPTGQNSAYPPHISTGNPSGYQIWLDLGEDGVLDMEVRVMAAISPSLDTYTRSMGTITGRLVPRGEDSGGEVMTGIALFEQFKLIE
ncbi:hypothetical protein FB451DRAFT_1228014 [Mycena latifolia]|nr:hypothetical protein FB451DRAFT_1228014 [Mycena latifolia]